ncbi:MAG: acyl-[acyl-carrier-protein]--UDP-N-acetylglucosamine O-acyltransferase, partial [Myxococcota bacterium]
DGATRIGDRCFIMGQCHVGHDCVIDDEVILSNCALISGHTHIGSGAVISGPVGVHQFVRIGRLSMLAAFAGVGQDVPPFMVVEGHRPPFIRTLNAVGLKRAGISSDSRMELRRTFRALYRSGKPVNEAVAELHEQHLGPEARELVDFYQPSKRGITPFLPYRSRRAPE